MKLLNNLLIKKEIEKKINYQGNRNLSLHNAV